MDDMKTFTASQDERQKIIERLRAELRKDKRIIFAYVFGSLVDQDAPFFRDVDIGIYVDEAAVSPDRLMDLSIGLSLSLESQLGRYPVDVIVFNDAPLDIAYRITCGELLFSNDEDLMADIVAKTWSMYHDHAITKRCILEEIIAA